MDTSIGAQILPFPSRQRYSALDELLAMGRITPNQHWCGIHMLWLHKIKMGNGYSQEQDGEWFDARCVDFDNALQALRAVKCTAAISNLCIFNEYSPSGLDVIHNGLDALVGLWGKAA